MTRIAHVVAPAPFGGLERVVAGLSREMARRGHEVSLILTLGPDEPRPQWADALSSAGVAVDGVRVGGRAYFAERRGVREALLRRRAEIVHTHGYRPDVVHRATARGLRLPVLSTAHGFASSGGKGRIYEWLQRRSWRGFDAVVAVSQPLVDRIVASGVPRERVEMIRNGTVISATPLLGAAEARERLGLPSGRIVGWVGRLSAEKAPGVAIEALAAAQDRSAILCYIGAGPLEQECRARAQSLGVADRVRFLGTVPDAAPLLPAFDVLLLSSHTEGTPMVVLEAAVARVPVVSTAVGGVPDLLAGDAGWLAPAADAAALGRCLDEALSDRRVALAKADRLGERVKGAAEANDWIESYLGLYSRLISANPS